jgi:hypothetical protein
MVEGGGLCVSGVSSNNNFTCKPFRPAAIDRLQRDGMHMVFAL